MAAQHLGVDEFFAKLSELFESRRKADHGSIFLTQKRLTFGNDTSASSPPSTTAALDDSLADLHPSSPLPVLIRATDGRSGENRRKRIKISTIVEPGILEKFYTRYAEVCKSGMQGLKKRDKSKRKKTKAKKRKAGGDGEKKT